MSGRSKVGQGHDDHVITVVGWHSVDPPHLAASKSGDPAYPSKYRTRPALLPAIVAITRGYRRRMPCLSTAAACWRWKNSSFATTSPPPPLCRRS